MPAVHAQRWLSSSPGHNLYNTKASVTIPELEMDKEGTPLEENKKIPVVSVKRIETFSAAHRLYNAKFSDEKNMEIFGKCGNKNGHGHNYTVEVTLEGPVDQDTGMVMNLVAVKEYLQDILKKVDHKNLDVEVEYFKNIVSSAENIAVYIWEKMAEKLPDTSLLKEVKLHETNKNSVMYKGQLCWMSCNITGLLNVMLNVAANLHGEADQIER